TVLWMLCRSSKFLKDKRHRACASQPEVCVASRCCMTGVRRGCYLYTVTHKGSAMREFNTVVGGSNRSPTAPEAGAPAAGGEPASAPTPPGPSGPTGHSDGNHGFRSARLRPA